jgi:anti-sigma factor RsiW
VTHLGQRLSALIDGELDGAERDRVLVHLARCEPCRGEAVALRALKRRMSALGETTADSALTHRLIHLARPEEIFRPAAAAGAALSLSRRDPRSTWYLAAGSIGVSLAGLATAAFMAGSAPQLSAPSVTPAVATFLNQHASDDGFEPATPAGLRHPVAGRSAVRMAPGLFRAAQPAVRTQARPLP